MSPLHSRFLALIDCVQDKYDVCGMDNLYHSVTFYKYFYTHPKKVNTQVTCRKGVQVIPSNVVQQEVTSIKGQSSVIVTVKSAVL